ncbi:uncharacterized protein BXIN_3073 [Babesia sp. Xinjiang]|uniref:uncharacterized protein n=1 Tax=Babesia sp. Xinjiang TaxID=462227 RepID=UPI000A26254C|nr:uncharacterized protein BXIN_3073 [Babesia sp. Xinjiang]ORM39333.1 hypothetical protein BXIN_3073 [Babesia sp. Xinjiang]
MQRGILWLSRASHPLWRDTSVTLDIARKSIRRPRCLRRTFSSSPKDQNLEEDATALAQGPKDTLLMLGYSVKENEMETHVKALQETLKLKMMTLKYYSEDMAQSFTDLAMAQHQSVQFINDAKENYLKALDIWRHLRGPESREVANMLCLIGVVLRDIGDIDAAMSAFEDSLKIDKKLGTVESQLSSVFAINNLAGIQHLKGNLTEAIELYEDAVRIMLTATGGDKNHRMIAILYYNIGRAQIRLTQCDAGCCHHYLKDRVAAETALRRVRLEATLVIRMLRQGI